VNELLIELAKSIQVLALNYIPKAYLLGKAKAAKKYGTKPIWTDKDKVNVELLLGRHAEELSTSMAALENKVVQGTSIDDAITMFRNRLSSWSWVLSPAVADGLSAYVDENRNEIARQEQIPSGDIGVIWYNARDAKVCPKCLYLSGRWFDAKQAYEIAATIHPNCRCPAHFDVGTPDEALVGPLPDYKPGAISDVYRDLNINGLTKERVARARRLNERGNPRAVITPMQQADIEKARRRAGQVKPSEMIRPEVNI
jgi:hypothetical protein